MNVRAISIRESTPAGARTPEYGEYIVVLEADGVQHTLTFSCRRTPTSRSIGWQPPQSSLSDRRVDVLVVRSVVDMVVAFHEGYRFELPQDLPPPEIEPGAAVIRL
jgi:hypothetical protein